MNRKLTARLVKAAIQNQKLNRIPNPTMAESFGEKFNSELAQQYLNPRGVIYESQEQSKQKSEIKKEKEKDPKDMPKEFGFKYDGAEPTRHGDWEHKGRCTDFEQNKLILESIIQLKIALLLFTTFSISLKRDIKLLTLVQSFCVFTQIYTNFIFLSRQILEEILHLLLGQFYFAIRTFCTLTYRRALRIVSMACAIILFTITIAFTPSFQNLIFSYFYCQILKRCPGYYFCFFQYKISYLGIFVVIVTTLATTKFRTFILIFKALTMQSKTF